MIHSEEIDKLATAMAKAQGEITGAKKDSNNTFFKSSYADLAACTAAVREPLAKNGLCVIQTPSTDDNGAVILTTMLAHSSGQWIRDTMACRPAKGDAQALGSVVSYLRRYSLSAITGLAQVDDDGEAAVGRGNGKGEEMTPVQRKEAGLWKGPLAITALKNKLRDLSAALKEAETQAAVANLTGEEYADVLEQAAEDLPDWYSKAEEAVQVALKGLPADTEPEVSNYAVPVPLASGKSNWPAWKEKVESMIDGAETLQEVNEIAEANKAAFGNYAKAQGRNAAALKTIIDNRRGFFAQQPKEDAA